MDGCPVIKVNRIIDWWQLDGPILDFLKHTLKKFFILDYILNESLRRRVQKGLNKGEAMNALARAKTW